VLIYNEALSLLNNSPEHFGSSVAGGAVLHSDRKSFSSLRASSLSGLAVAAVSVASLALAACGNTYRPVVSAINPVGPAGQPTKYAEVISTTGPSTPGLSTLVDFSGDTIVNTTLIGVDPRYLILDTNGFEAYTLNGDGTLNSFSVSSFLLANQVVRSTLLTNSNPVSIYPQGSSIYVAEAGRNAIAQLQGLPPAIHQELPTGAGTVYTVGANGSPRAYSIVQGTPGSVGTVSAIETGSNTISASIPVGVTPVYGVMTADSRRAFILNKGSNNLSVINAQSNAPDTFTTSSGVTNTIPVGVAPVWADFAPTLSELLVANAGNGTTAGSVTIVSIPLCNAGTVVTNPNCDPANPIDAVGFGQIVANIPVGINPVMIAVLQDGTQAYVANAGNGSNPGSISVINLVTNTVIATLPAGTSTNQLDLLVHGHPSFIAATTGTPTGKVYVTSTDSTDLTIIRTDTDTVAYHLPLQGKGVAVRVSQQ
jgi:YVTN family beta-propeller protein